MSTALNRLLLVLLVTAAWALLQGVFLLASDTSPLHGRLTDTDSYMRLVRVTELVDEGDWYDITVDRGNAPYGDELHWTRPLDVLVIAAAAPLAPFVDRDDALFWGGAALCPLLLLAALFALAWAAAPLVGPFSPLLIAAFLVNPALMGVFQPGRLDHHALQILLFVVIIGFGVRAVREASLRPAIAAGAVGAVGVWVSIEMLIPLAALVAVLGLQWIGGRRQAAGAGLALAAASVGTLAVALAIERTPSDWSSTDLDRLSSVHVAMLAALAFGWLAICVADRRPRLAGSPLRRSVSAAGAAGATVVLLAVIAPRAFLGPDADIDPALRPIWLDKVVEMRPLLPSSPSGIGPLLLFAGQALLAVPTAVVVLYRHRAGPLLAAWAFVALLLAGYLVLTLQHARTAAFLAVPAIIFLVEGLLQLRRWLERLDSARLRAAAWAGASVGVVVGFLVLGGAVTAAAIEPDKGLPSEPCYVDQVAPFLSDPSGLGARQSTIAAYIDLGPQILHFTRHAVLAGPYHRNATGILDLHTLFTATDARPRAIVEERGIDLVLLCASDGERAFFADPEPVPGSLYDQLLANAPPPWLDRVDLPEPAASRFILYRVNQ